MCSFEKKIILFSFYSLLISLLLTVAYVFKYDITRNDIPAPHLSDSFSLNEKIEFLRKNKKCADIIALGSSICLNNLHSETVQERFRSDSYLNASSWGMNMEDNYLFLKMLCEIHIPSKVIIASNISEFQESPKKTNYSVLKNYLVANDLVADLYYLLCFNLSYYIDNFKYAKKVRSSRNDYAYLVFDKYGGINLDDKDFKIDQRRWNTDFECGKIIASNYFYIDSISSFCKDKNINLLFFQSPFRNGLYSNFDKNKLNELKLHINKIENILKKNKHVFINSNAVSWDDNLFIDGEHLNIKGAKFFTEYCFDKIESIKISSLNSL